MNTNRHLASIISVVALSVRLVTAQAPAATPPTTGEPARPPRPPVDLALDANHDEIMDAGEIAAAATALKTLDLNGDGRLTPDETRPTRPEGQKPAGRERRLPGQPPTAGSAGLQGEAGTSGSPPVVRRPRPPVIVALDVSGDGVIDAAELARAVEALTKLDRNGDGRLTPEEYRPPRPAARDATSSPGPAGG